MKNIRFLTVILALLMSVFIGGMVSSFSGLEFSVGNINVVPYAISALLFGCSFIPMAPAGSLSTYVLVDVNKPGQNAGRGGNLKDEIVFFDMDDVVTMPARDANEVEMQTGDIALATGAFMVTIYATPGTIENTSKSQGDPDAKGFIQGVKFKHPGNEKEIREFTTNCLNRNLGVIHRKCSDPSSMDIYGTPCAPLQMQSSWTQNKDQNFTEFTFESLQVGPNVGIYKGAISLDPGSGSGI